MSELHQALRLPDTMSHDDIGPYIRSLREHYGLSQQEVSDRLHIRSRYVHAIEEGQFEQLPGKVYAKGYVQTYAEFLGLDPDQVAAICFGPELAREQQSHFVPVPARPGARIPKAWIWAGVAVAVLLGLYSLMNGEQPSSDEAAVSQARDVPESMLVDMRDGTMPTPDNIDCLTGRGYLACFYDSRLVKRWVMPAIVPAYVSFANSAPQEETPDPANGEEE